MKKWEKQLQSRNRVIEVVKPPTQNLQVPAESKLTPEQIKNWRRALCLTLGPYAVIMPSEEIQAIRDKMQAAVKLIPEEK